MRQLYFFLFLIFLCSFSSKAQWNIQQIGVQPGLGAMDIEMSDGRNDGVQRIYISSTAGNIYEWSYSNGTWTETLVTENKYAGLINMELGDGRNDAKNRLYFNEHTAGGRIFEMTWNGVSWTENLVTTLDPLSSPTSIMVGDGRGDGIGRLYVGGAPWGVTEYTWTGSSWLMDTVMTTSYSESDGVIGNGRGDGKNRVYINGNCPLEADYNNSWSDQYLESCNISSWADAMHIGAGRNDGVLRVYSNAEAAGKREFTWNGSSWNELLISSNGGRGDVHLAALRADALNRLYVTGSIHWTGSPPGSDLVEYEWNINNSSWDSLGIVVDAITGATGWVATGNGRNDDTLRLYAPNTSTGVIYEVTAPHPNYIGSPTLVTDISEVQINIFPNPINRDVTIRINSSKNISTQLSILNLIGEEIYSDKNLLTSNQYTIDLEYIPTGIYIVKILVNEFYYFKKLVKE